MRGLTMLICSLARVKVNTTLMIQFLMQEGRSLLTMAAQCGHKGLLKFLLHHGADAYQIDSVSRAMVVSNHNWASEASPTLWCSIEISRDIYIYMYICMSVCLVCQINCVGGITWTKHAHAQSLFFWRFNQ